MSKKTTYIATAPDGTTGARNSERNYPFALAVLIGGMPERTVKRVRWIHPGEEVPAGAVADLEFSADRGGDAVLYRWTEVAPAFAPHWVIASFHGTRAAAEKASPGYDRAVRKVVIETTVKGQDK
jgi:hypothetical protein